MKVAGGEELLRACVQPTLARLGLALRTVSISAGVKRDGRKAATRTSIYVSTERRRAAVSDGTQHFELLVIQPVLVPVHEWIALRANNVGHLHGRPAHFFKLLRERGTRSRSETGRVSKGLVTACR